MATDDELRMKLADLGSPEALADCIIDHFPDINGAVPLERIADALGILEITKCDTGSFEAVLVTNNAKSTGAISVNANSHRERQRYSVAHELGHYLLPFHGENAQCAKADMGVLKAKQSNQDREAEANRFASALLMPQKLFKADLRRLRNPEIGQIVTLAERYKVSKEACARRYTELHDHLCAVVFSRDGKVRYAPRKPEFPYIDVSKDQPLPPNSLSAKGNGSVNFISDWAEMSAGVWLGASPRLRGKQLYEQYLVQKDGYRMTMLTLDDGPDDDEADEDGDMEESWTPRFRR